MRLLSFFLDIICAPLEWGVRFFGRLTCAFLLSPWGLLIPVALLAAFFIAQKIAILPARLAVRDALQWESCDDEAISNHVRRLQTMGTHGLPGLIRGLSSEREAVYGACYESLRQTLLYWKEQNDANAKMSFFQALSEGLLNDVDQMSPPGRAAAAEFARPILQELAACPAQNRAQILAINQTCEKLLVILDTYPKSEGTFFTQNVEPQRDRLARYSQQGFRSTLAFSGESQSAELEGLLDPLATARADRLYAYQHSTQYVEQSQIPFVPERERPVRLLVRDTEMITLLGEDDKEQKIPSNLPTLKSAPIGSKVAKDAAAQNLSADFAREYLTNETLASAPHGKQKSVFLSEELAQTAISSYDRLTSSQLMRLLHHHDISHVNAARRVLASRDGFSESHLQLAYRLYHPDHERRRELVTRLAETPGTRNAAWLRELLNDPDNNVRYQAASFLATSQDLNLRLLLIEKGQHDRDARIVQLAERLRTIQP